MLGLTAGAPFPRSPVCPCSLSTHGHSPREPEPLRQSCWRDRPGTRMAEHRVVRKWSELNSSALTGVKKTRCWEAEPAHSRMLPAMWVGDGWAGGLWAL